MYQMEQIIKCRQYALVFLLMVFLPLIRNGNASTEQLNQQQKIMYKTKFIPNDFQNMECGYHSVIPNACTPQLEKGKTGIKINGPRQMICYIITSDTQAIGVTVVPYLPICFSYKITKKRQYKHYEESNIIIYIKNEKDKNWTSGVVHYEDDGYNIPSPEEEEDMRKIQEEVKNAQNYSEDTLDKGPSFGATMNLNVLEYVNIPLKSGEYEIYLTNFGLESNHIIVKIVIKS